MYPVLMILIGLLTFILVRTIPHGSIWWAAFAGVIFWIGLEAYALARR